LIKLTIQRHTDIMREDKGKEETNIPLDTSRRANRTHCPWDSIFMPTQ
jgi:hypothetical protein